MFCLQHREELASKRGSQETRGISVDWAMEESKPGLRGVAQEWKNMVRVKTYLTS